MNKVKARDQNLLVLCGKRLQWFSTTSSHPRTESPQIRSWDLKQTRGWKPPGGFTGAFPSRGKGVEVTKQFHRRSPASPWAEHSPAHTAAPLAPAGFLSSKVTVPYTPAWSDFPWKALERPESLQPDALNAAAACSHNRGVLLGSKTTPFSPILPNSSQNRKVSWCINL